MFGYTARFSSEEEADSARNFIATATSDPFGETGESFPVYVTFEPRYSDRTFDESSASNMARIYGWFRPQEELEQILNNCGHPPIKISESMICSPVMISPYHVTTISTLVIKRDTPADRDHGHVTIKYRNADSAKEALKTLDYMITANDGQQYELRFVRPSSRR